MDSIGEKMNAPTDTTFSTAACGLAFRCGSASCTRNTGPRRLTSNDLVNASTVIDPERLGQRVRGIVDHHIDAAELVDGALHQCSEVLDVADVRRHADRLAAEVTQMRGGLVAGLGFAAGHDDARTGEDEPLGEREADAAGAAGHDDGAVGHVEETVKCCAVHAGQLNTSACAATYCSTVCAGRR